MSAFSLNEFYQRNRRVVIWVILFLLLWLLRDFFAVVFLSFVLAIVAAPLAEIGMRRLRLPHWAAVTVVYVMLPRRARLVRARSSCRAWSPQSIA